ncbi:serine/threonine protein kinase [Streptomyces sp. Je 1-4]|uniref:serine/threonine-protein kinase n=1 Tax=unclassified Streptomyces TaxID=2593676 RepID=UPI0021DAF145|nr:serine/threonine-protein kinase [Streptomyces sp. Je 1-4]UYB41530.1 serine/threonine protein kinase [Streptomyces sp. Je 1-4]UZQ37772.1 serine/threonine protein kinase [Streptomyces sp. Je 1-4] [Streptomyces sp. Je 1-4 4N24]UZQ45189.1 serine/threonine protein kinase [Streptomyces sp. Je 1-4] [Streptomyces sp. Je 1-4 4N24_ara]
MEQPIRAGQQGRPGRAERAGWLRPLDAQDPARIGDYRLLGRLGQGGMGRVFLARSDRGRTVAVKLVHPELAGEEEFRARFRREVRAAQRVGGEWTAPVLDADTEAGTPWVATGYIAGPSLQRVVGGGTPLPERSVRILAAGLARALGAIHAAGIIHRDLKPSNVLLTIDGPRVIDFGIARALEAVTGNGVTRTGDSVGSPGFMSPEQVRGEPLTPACDVFSLGSVLAYAATGRQPFGTADSIAHALMFRIAQEEPDLSALPDGLRELVSGCLAKDPEQRPTPAELVAQAERGAGGGPGADDEPWLPGALIARLGRHAVELLEAEDPQDGENARGGDRAGAPSAVPSPAPEGPGGVHALPTAVSHTSAPGRTPATPPPGPVAPGPASHPPHTARADHGPAVPAPAPASRRRRGAGAARFAAFALVLAGVGAATVYAVLGGDGDGVRAEDAHGKDGRASGQSAANGGIPTDFLGTWETTLDGSAVNARRLTLIQGETGDTVLTMTATGASYRCAFAATLISAGPPVRLGPSTVVSGPDGCRPGESSTLEMVGGTLRRVSDDGKALSYRKTG